MRVYFSEALVESGWEAQKICTGKWYCWYRVWLKWAYCCFWWRLWRWRQIWMDAPTHGVGRCCLSWYDSVLWFRWDNADKVGYAHGAVKANAQEDDVVFVGETTASADVTATQVNILPQTFQGEVSNSVSLVVPKGSASWPQPHNDGFPMEWNYWWSSSYQTSWDFPCIGLFTLMLQEAWTMEKSHKATVSWVDNTGWSISSYSQHWLAMNAFSLIQRLWYQFETVTIYIPTDQQTDGMMMFSFLALHNWPLITRTSLSWNKEVF